VVPAKPVTISNNSANCASVSNVNSACDLVLPVQYTAWYAEKTQSLKSFLFWSTASEFNNSGWNILRSKDGKAWESIGWVDGKENTIQERIYDFTDPQPMNGLNYYRLKQIDYDGITSYSDVKSLEFRSDALSVFPNPVSDKLFIKDANDYAEFTITDMSGRIIRQGNINEENIDVSNLNEGCFLVRITSNGETSRHRFVKVY